MTVFYGAASASESYGSNPPGLAVDGNSGTHWIDNASPLPQWWAVATNTTPVTAYAVTSDDAARAINTWQFQGAIGATLRDVPSGSITTASSRYSTGAWDWINATDSLWTDAWTSLSSAPQWLRVQLPTATVYTQYSVGAHSGWLYRAPKTWTFEGSNDGSTWTTLDTQTNITTWVDTVFNSYTFSNSTAYLYYRLNISVGNDASYVEIARFLLGPPPRADVPAGTITSASSEYSSTTYADDNATDGNWTTRWASLSSAPQWLRVQLPTATVCTTYSLGGFASELYGQPKTWTFEGSNDGSTWTTLDTRTGITTWLANTLNTYTFSNSTAYLYYRINVSVNGDGSYVRLARFWIGPLPPSATWVTLDSNSGVTWTVGQTRSYAFINTTAYTDYRLYITANNGDGYTQIAEITMTDVSSSPQPYSRHQIPHRAAIARGTR